MYSETQKPGSWMLPLAREEIEGVPFVLDVYDVLFFVHQKPHPLVSSRFQEYLKTKEGMSTIMYIAFLDHDCIHTHRSDSYSSSTRISGLL